MKINITYIISILIILQACSEANTKLGETNKEQQFNNNCTDSLFIDFCDGINPSQYKAIQNQLFATGRLLKTDSIVGYVINIVEKDFTDTSKLKNTEILFSINPEFINDSLKLISLTFNSIANHLPKNRIELYNKNIRKLYESKYGSPETKEITSEDKITYTWHLDNKVITIIESFQLEWDVLKKKNYKVLTPFEIIYENKSYYINQNRLNVETAKENRNIEVSKQTKTLKEI